jgi:hypothetical protein
MLSLGAEREAFHAVNALAAKGELPLASVKLYQKDIASLPPMTFEPMGTEERLFIYDIVRTASANKLRILQFMPFDDEHRAALEKLVADPRIDWNEVLRHLQSQCDRIAAAARLGSYAEQCSAVANIVEETRSQADESAKPETLQKVLGPNATRREIWLVVARIIWEPFGSPSRTYIQIPALYHAHLRLHQLVLALAAYRHEQKTYPKSFAALTPKYTDRVPLDPFADADYKYSRLPDGGFLLYSIGPNRTDDGGKKHEVNVWADKDTASEEERSWDDIAVRSPPREEK